MRRGYLERMKRDTGARIICASLFFPFSWILLKKRRARFFVYFGHGATHPRSNFPLSFLLFFPNFSLENQPKKSCCCCCSLLRVVDLAPWLLAPAWRLIGNFFLTYNLDDEMWFKMFRDFFSCRLVCPSTQHRTNMPVCILLAYNYQMETAS